MINSICLLVICVVIAVQTQGDRHTMPILIFSGSRAVYSIHLSGGNITNELPKGSLTQPFGLTYDSDDRIMYIIDSSTIKSFRLGDPGSLNVVVILPEGYYSSIAIDQIREQLFVCEDLTDIIYRVWKNGTGLEEWLQVSAANDMVVDSQQGWLYWTELNAKRVMRVPVTDPTGVEVVISNADFPYGIHIDTNTNRLYWSGYTSDTIEEALLDGGNRTFVAEVPALFMYHMTGLNGHLYLAAYNDSKGCIYDVYNGSYSTLGAYEDIRPKGIALIRDAEIVVTTSTVVKQDTSTVELTSNTVEPSATTTESTSNTVQLDTATATMGRPKDLSSSFTIGTTNSNAFQTTPPANHKITSSWPSFGPAAGGTWITVTGINLPVEYNLTISIGDVACHTKLENSSTLIGITKGVPLAEAGIIGRSLPVSVKAYDSVVIRSTYMFTYRENPVIDKVYPKESIITGGTLLTVEGDNLASVAVVWMEVMMILKTLHSSEPLVYNKTITNYATECQITNQTQMHCPTPTLDIPSGFLNQTSKSTPIKRDIHLQASSRKTIKFRILEMQTPQIRLKRETVKLEYSHDGDILEFYIGFRLDGVHDYENFTTIDVYTEPTISVESTTKIFKAGQRLLFIGNGLDSGITVFDYSVNIGTGDCVDLELLSNSLSCYPPQRKPAADEDEDDASDLTITIHVGLNLKHFAGYLRYPDKKDIGTEKKLPLYIIIPATVIPVLVTTIIIVAIYATKRRRGCCQDKNN